jgi:exonuclease VII small subunit
MTLKVSGLERRAKELKAEVERLEQLRRELRAEIVPYEKGGELVRAADIKHVTVRLQRTKRVGKQSSPDKI